MVASVIIALTIISSLGSTSCSLVKLAVVIVPILGEGRKPTAQN
jgi:hypothetical protein